MCPLLKRSIDMYNALVLAFASSRRGISGKFKIIHKYRPISIFPCSNLTFGRNLSNSKPS